MKTLLSKITVLFLAGIFSASSAFSQKGVETNTPYGKGRDSVECIKNLSLFFEFYKHQNFKDAIGPWRNVFNNCPGSRESVFAYGVEMYKSFADTKDETLRGAYVDTIMMIHEKRIKYFGDEGQVRGRQGIDLLRLRRTDGPQYIKQGYDLLKKSIELQKEKSTAPVLTAFITSGVSLFSDKQIADEQLINDYVMVNDILDAQLKRGGSSSTKQAKEYNDKNIRESRVLTCDAVNKIYGPKLEANKENAAFLKLVGGFLKDANCEGEPFFASVSESLYELEPSAESAYNIARLYFKKEDYDKAETYYNEAINSTNNTNDKANYYYELGIIHNSFLKQPREAVEAANEAIKLRPEWGEPYLLLGQSYILGKNSYTDAFTQETVFWAAVDMFQKAKSVDPAVTEKANTLINEYSRYFPTKEDIFFRTLSVGQSYTVGGWINKTTTVRTR